MGRNRSTSESLNVYTLFPLALGTQWLFYRTYRDRRYVLALQDGKPITLVDETQVTITTRDVVGNAGIISTTYQAFPQDVKSGDRILLDDGLLDLRVIGTSETDVQCVVVQGGELGEHKGINLPGVAVSSPALTEQDRYDVQFGIAHGVDYVALSFVRRPEDLREAKQLIRHYATEVNGEEGRWDIPLIAKIEKPEAVEHLDEILEVTDGIMVARGDLGVEMAPEKGLFRTSRASSGLYWLLGSSVQKYALRE
jgi:pyruvate kinase